MTVDESAKVEPLREYGSLTKPFTPENLETARRILAWGQAEDWLDGSHKSPCVPFRDVEWLFGYIDRLTAIAKEAMSDCGTSSLTHHLLRKIVPDWENEGNGAAAKANTMCKHGMHFGGHYCEDCEDERRAGAERGEPDGSQ